MGPFKGQKRGNFDKSLKIFEPRTTSFMH